MVDESKRRTLKGMLGATVRPSSVFTEPVANAIANTTATPPTDPKAAFLEAFNDCHAALCEAEESRGEMNAFLDTVPKNPSAKSKRSARFAELSERTIEGIEKFQDSLKKLIDIQGDNLPTETLLGELLNIARENNDESGYIAPASNSPELLKKLKHYGIDVQNWDSFTNQAFGADSDSIPHHFDTSDLWEVMERYIGDLNYHAKAKCDSATAREFEEEIRGYAQSFADAIKERFGVEIGINNVSNLGTKTAIPANELGDIGSTSRVASLVGSLLKTDTPIPSPAKPVEETAHSPDPQLPPPATTEQSIDFTIPDLNGIIPTNVEKAEVPVVGRKV